LWDVGRLLFALRDAVGGAPWGTADARPAALGRVWAAAAGGRLRSPAAVPRCLLGVADGDGNDGDGGGGGGGGDGGAPPFAITRGVVVEAPSMSGDASVALGGQLWLRRRTWLYGEHARADAEEAVDVAPAVAAAVATALRLPLLVEAPLYEAASGRLGGGGAAAPPPPPPEAGGGAPPPAPSAASTPPPWELTAAAVGRDLPPAALRASLAAAGVGSRRADGRDALVRAALPLMDEAARREVLLTRAAAAGEYALAARLQAGRSARHRAAAGMAAAAAAGRYAEAARLGGVLSAATDCRADVTQEEGAYDRYLDKDEEYERARRRVMGGG